MRKLISVLAGCLTLLIIGPTTFAQRTAEDYYKASQTLLRNRDLDGALAALDKAIELKLDFAQAYAQRNRVHMMKGEVDSALADLSKALLYDPQMKHEYVERGHIRMLKND